MFYWLIILFGIVILTTSISNPLYKLTLKKFLRLSIFSEFLLRICLFFLSIIIIFLGLYIESIL